MKVKQCSCGGIMEAYHRFCLYCGINREGLFIKLLTKT